MVFIVTIRLVGETKKSSIVCRNGGAGIVVVSMGARLRAIKCNGLISAYFRYRNAGIKVAIAKMHKRDLMFQYERLLARPPA